MKRRVICTPMFLAAMSTIAKLWKELRCPSTEEWIKKIWSVHTMEYYSAIRKDECPPFASTWLKLEGIMLSELSQQRKQFPLGFTYMWNKRNSIEDVGRKKGKMKGEIRRGDEP